MATLLEEIVAAIRKTPGLTDRELTNQVRGRAALQQPVNQAARQLEKQGSILRRKRPDGLIGNYLSVTEIDVPTTPKHTVVQSSEAVTISEDDVKKILDDWLQVDGWQTAVAWGKVRGIDIDAKRGTERWIIEVKGPGSLQPMRVNYFIGILGETLQRMSDPDARYSIAFPDHAQYRGLWRRLPNLAKTRTQISLLLVSADGRIEHLTE